MRTSTNLTILFLALVMGGIAAFLARDWLATHATSNTQTVGTVVVAAAPLGFGAQLTPDNVTEVSWSSSTLPDGAFATVKDLLKDGRRVVLTPLVRNEPVVKVEGDRAWPAWFPLDPHRGWEARRHRRGR